MWQWEYLYLDKGGSHYRTHNWISCFCLHKVIPVCLCQLVLKGSEWVGELQRLWEDYALKSFPTFTSLYILISSIHSLCGVLILLCSLPTHRDNIFVWEHANKLLKVLKMLKNQKATIKRKHFKVTLRSGPQFSVPQLQRRGNQLHEGEAGKVSCLWANSSRQGVAWQAGVHTTVDKRQHKLSESPSLLLFTIFTACLYLIHLQKKSCLFLSLSLFLRTSSATNPFFNVGLRE